MRKSSAPNQSLPWHCHEHPILMEPGDFTAAVPVCSDRGTLVGKLCGDSVWDLGLTQNNGLPQLFLSNSDLKLV